MKSVTEIINQINFPRFTDMLGNEVNPGDIIVLTNTGTKKMYKYIVSNKIKLDTNKIVLIPMFNSSNISFDVSEICQAKESWHTPSILKINSLVNSIDLDKAKTKYQAFIDKNNNFKADQKAKRAEKYQYRMFIVFAVHKTTKVPHIMFYGVKSQQGKVLSKQDIKTAIEQIYNQYNTDYELSVMSIMHDNTAKFQVISKYCYHLDPFIFNHRSACNTWGYKGVKVNARILYANNCYSYLLDENCYMSYNNMYPIITDKSMIEDTHFHTIGNWSNFNTENSKHVFVKDIIGVGYSHYSPFSNKDYIPISCVLSEPLYIALNDFVNYCKNI